MLIDLLLTDYLNKKPPSDSLSPKTKHTRTHFSVHYSDMRGRALHYSETHSASIILMIQVILIIVLIYVHSVALPNGNHTCTFLQAKRAG